MTHSHTEPLAPFSRWTWVSQFLSPLVLQKNRCGYWLLVKVLRPTRHKTGHFGDVPQANLLAWYGKTELNTTKTPFTNQMKCTTTQNKHKKLQPGLVTSYDIRPGE